MHFLWKSQDLQSLHIHITKQDQAFTSLNCMGYRPSIYALKRYGI
uniref:Uncharacterized protein n=1 Tax=Siphoviridae sp. ctaA31 TaxID=2827894 RepID=A0A8S5T4E2_9CAUD|nr:MAG TPA: hypothetical protein [Siphoviridae sp. ctaA31]